MDELKESINRGIPIATPVTLSSTDLIALCDDKETTKNAIDNAFTKYMNYMKKIGIPPHRYGVFPNVRHRYEPKYSRETTLFF